MGFFEVFRRKSSKNNSLSKRLPEAGNAFVMLFGAVGMVGVLGASTMTIMKGPVKSMSEVTKRTITENNMIAATKLAIIVSASDPSDGGDCDADGTIEPVEMAGAHPTMSGASVIPGSIGVQRQDSWGTEMAYCTWDYGTTINGGGCAGGNRKTGGATADQMILAIISAGPDKIFQSSCINYVNSTTPVVNKPGGSDDLVLGYTETEAIGLSGGLWNLKTGDTTTAEITKNLEVSDGAAAQLQFDAGTKTLQIGDGSTGSGLFPLVRTDMIDDYNMGGGTIDMNSPVDVSGGALTVSGGGINLTGGNLDMNARELVDTGRITGGNWHAIYDTWIQGNDLSTPGGNARNLALLGRKDTDVLYLNYNGEYTAGTIIGPVSSPNVTISNAGQVRADGGLNVDGRQIIDAGGTQFYSNSTYGYFGADSNDMIRFDNGGAAYIQVNGTWEFYWGNTHFSPYTDNVNTLGNSSRHWSRIYAKEICDGTDCTDVNAIGTGGGGGGGAACAGTGASWSTCSASLPNTPDGLTATATDSYCCSPPSCSSCSGTTGSRVYLCDNGSWIPQGSGTCSNCSLTGGGCCSCSCSGGCGDDGDCDESIEDMLKLKGAYETIEAIIAKEQLEMTPHQYISNTMKENREKGSLR